MSIARGCRDGKSNKAMVEVEVEVSSFSRGTNNIHDNNLISHYNTTKLEESDEDLLTVPDVEARAAMDSSDNNNNNNNNNKNNNTDDQIQNHKRRRGRNPVDKEYRRLKRLLRNRVSAQQARERKKVYVNDLESRAKELQDLNSKLEETISTLLNENAMLRKVLLNTRPKVDDTTHVEQKQQDQLPQS